MKGVGSHGSCKNYYKDFVIASADMPDVDTTDAYVQHMAVCNCISCPVWNYLHYSSLRIWIRAGNRHRSGKNAFGRFYTLYPACTFWLGGVWLETIKIRLMGDKKDGINGKYGGVPE